MRAHPFIVLGLPCSRTYWLSRFLSYRDWHCGHDELQHMRSLDDCRTWFTQPNVGTVETAAAPFWRLFPKDAVVVTIRRPVDDSLASVMRIFPGIDTGAMRRTLEAVDRKLDQVEARAANVMSVRFADLKNEWTCAAIFEKCLPYQHDPDWWAALDPTVISGNLAAQARYCQAYLPQLQKLARAAKHRMLADLAPRARAPDGFTFQQEPFDEWYRDAQPLFREHMVLTGQDVDDHAMKNLQLARWMDNAGAVQITTARSNGRMFGYCIATISPTLDAQDTLVGYLRSPFASKDFPGLGRKIVGAAIERLKRDGVADIFGQAGVRGSGHRIGSIFRRLGFEDAGELFRLNVKEASAWA